MLERAERFLRAKRKNHLAKTVNYTRFENGTQISTPLTATPAATIVDVAGGEIVVRSDVVDWLIDVPQFEMYIGSCPRPGDKIEEASRNGDGISDAKVYEVMGVAGQPCYRYHGRDMMTFRIHTKRTNAEFNPRDLQY